MTQLSDVLEVAQDDMCLTITGNDAESLDGVASVWVILQPEGSESALVVQCNLSPDERELSVTVTAFRQGVSVPPNTMLFDDAAFTSMRL